MILSADGETTFSFIQWGFACRCCAQLERDYLQPETITCQNQLLLLFFFISILVAYAVEVCLPFCLALFCLFSFGVNFVLRCAGQSLQGSLISGAMLLPTREDLQDFIPLAAPCCNFRNYVYHVL